LNNADFSQAAKEKIRAWLRNMAPMFHGATPGPAPERFGGNLCALGGGAPEMRKTGFPFAGGALCLP